MVLSSFHKCPWLSAAMCDEALGHCIDAVVVEALDASDNGIKLSTNWLGMWPFEVGLNSMRRVHDIQAHVSMPITSQWGKMRCHGGRHSESFDHHGVDNINTSQVPHHGRRLLWAPVEWTKYHAIRYGKCNGSALAATLGPTKRLA